MKTILSILMYFMGHVLATERPIIGIVTEEVKPEDRKWGSSFIAASYVKAIEQSGARVVPIFINKTEEYYSDILNSVNGVLFPGGSVYFNTTQGGYGDTGKIILNYSKKINSAGDYFPILGICLGYELLIYLDVENYSVLGYCNSLNVALPVTFKKKFRESKLYHDIPQDIVQIMTTLSVTYNHHKRCVTEDLLRQHNLTRKWKVLSISLDLDGKKFISSIESKTYPFAGVQFHPEKSAFEWNPSQKSVHSHKSIYSSRYFFDWLVNEARKNNHSFDDSSAEDEALIYNYLPTYVNDYYEQIYYFN